MSVRPRPSAVQTDMPICVVVAQRTLNPFAQVRTHDRQPTYLQISFHDCYSSNSEHSVNHQLCYIENESANSDEIIFMIHLAERI